MKKKYIFLASLVCLLGSNKGMAQSKIKDGTIASSSLANTNAILDLESNKRGLLLPRIALTATNSFAPLTAHVQGMAVYNTATAGSGGTAVTPGYYYNDGTQWLRLNTGTGAWALTGNAGTAPATNFIGTTDNVDLVARTNNLERFRITSDGKVGIATTTPGSALTVQNDNTGDETRDDISIRSHGTTAPGYLTYRSRGTAAAPTNLANGDLLSATIATGRVNGTDVDITSIKSNYKGTGTNNLANMVFATSATDRMIIDEDGKVLIGTTTVPAGGTNAKFIVDNGTTNGAVQIKDGTEGTGKLLTSDANGLATWASPSAVSFPKSFYGTMETSTTDSLVGTGLQYLNWFIDIEANSTYYLNWTYQFSPGTTASANGWVQILTQFSTSKTAVNTTGLSLLSNPLALGTLTATWGGTIPVFLGQARGAHVIRNNTGSTIRLFLLGQVFQGWNHGNPRAISSFGENSIVALELRN